MRPTHSTSISEWQQCIYSIHGYIRTHMYYNYALVRMRKRGIRLCVCLCLCVSVDYLCVSVCRLLQLLKEVQVRVSIGF